MREPGARSATPLPGSPRSWSITTACRWSAAILPVSTALAIWLVSDRVPPSVIVAFRRTGSVLVPRASNRPLEERMPEIEAPGSSVNTLLASADTPPQPIDVRRIQGRSLRTVNAVSMEPLMTTVSRAFPSRLS